MFQLGSWTISNAMSLEIKRTVEVHAACRVDVTEALCFFPDVNGRTFSDISIRSGRLSTPRWTMAGCQGNAPARLFVSGTRRVSRHLCVACGDDDSEEISAFRAAQARLVAARWRCRVWRDL